MIKKLIKNIVVVSAMLALGGCATSKTIYYWGDYSESAYQYKHEPTVQSSSEHKAALQEIIDNAAGKNKRIPPGIYAELAKFEFEANNLNAARQLLIQEQALFPESARIVEVLLEMINAKENVNASNN